MRWLSPAADDARWWLRGDADQVPEDRLAGLRLPMTSPSVADVIQGVAELLQVYGTPLVLCFDQLEVLFENNQEAFRELTSQLMGWLQTIPNLVIAVGCFEDVWKQVVEDGGYLSFINRVRKHDLQALSPDQATEFIQRRMKTWTDHDLDKGAGWPFDLESVTSVRRKTRQAAEWHYDKP